MASLPKPDKHQTRKPNPRSPSSSGQRLALLAVGDRSRQHILELLRDGPLSVGEIANDLPVTRPAVSKHLRVLEEAQLVTHESQGNRNLYRLAPEGAEALRAYLDELWGSALQRLALMAENLPERSPTERPSTRSRSNRRGGDGKKKPGGAVKP